MCLRKGVCLTTVAKVLGQFGTISVKKSKFPKFVSRLAGRDYLGAIFRGRFLGSFSGSVFLGFRGFLGIF